MSQVCKTCKEDLSLDKFRTGLKSCKKCNYNKTKCEHGKEKKKCVICDGSGLCEHKKQKHACKVCNPEKYEMMHCQCGICKSSMVSKKSKYYPLCEPCFCQEYPDSPLSVNYKTKERYLFDEIKNRFSGVSMRLNKRVDNGCSGKKPDILIDKGIFSIIIECDENQHKNYECEEKRIMELFQDLGNRPLIVIRFNPDSYITNSVKYDGCFEDIKHLYQKKYYNLLPFEWCKRISVLEGLIKKYLMLDEIPSKEIVIEKLFYDGYRHIENIIYLKDLDEYTIKASYFDSELNHTLKIEKDENELYIKIEKGIVKIISKLQFDNRM
uniref:Uncharacterized protein n=1 Tax=viral metagenome TaxID=1070528 RepID=A0A6C0DKH6_9ZZZZ